MRASGSVCLLLLLLFIGAAQAAPPDARRVQGARVEVSSAWLELRGLLVGDRRTVITPAAWADPGRAIRVRPALGEGRWTEAVDVRVLDGSEGAYVLRLGQDLPVRPLPISSDSPAIGDHVWVLGGTREEPAWLETTVVSTGGGRFRIEKPPGSTPWGGAVVDGTGAVLGISTGTQTVHVVSESLARAETAPGRGLSILPHFGFRFGAELSALGNAGLLEIDTGLTLMDRLTLALTVGVAFSDETQQHSLDAKPGLGPGVVEEHLGRLRVGLEAKYRQLLSGQSGFPIYLDLAVGGFYGLTTWEPHGVAMYGQPGCDPTLGPCALTVGHPESRLEHSLGLSVGADLRFGALSIGYRYAPGALGINTIDTHMLLMGFSLF